MSNVFSKDAVRKLGDNYHTKVRPVHGKSSRGGCMKAVYIGLGSLYGNDFGFRGPFHRSFFRRARRKENQRGLQEGRLNTIDRVFRALVHEGIVFQEQIFRPMAGNRWKMGDGSRVNKIEDVIIEQTMILPNGSHFFGAAISGAIHSILLRIEKRKGNAVIYWMDQFSDGYSAVRPRAFIDKPDVTGKLDETIRKFGTNTTSIWLFNPDGALDVGIEIDTDGDGMNDMCVPAVEVL
jgi:hypothetical protein